MIQTVKFNETISLINNVIKEFNYKDVVAVTIYGKTVYLQEHQMRALQVVCKRLYDESEEKYIELCNNITIYKSNKIEDNKDRQLTILNDGRLSDTFDNGFYNFNTSCSFAIMKF